MNIVHGYDFMSLVWFCLFLRFRFRFWFGRKVYHTPKTWVEPIYVTTVVNTRDFHANTPR